MSKRLRILILATCVCPALAAASASCGRDGIALQILGSGGPIADDARASAAYVVWIDGSSRFLIDAGGGTFLRFGEAAASFDELDFIGLSHFHTDHSADFPALLKSGYFSDRQRRSLVVAGPAAGGPYPGLDTYFDSLLRPDAGAYHYLAGYLDGTGGLPKLTPREVADGGNAERLFEDTRRAVEINALHVPHGIVPTLAFRVRVGDTIIVFAGDQNGSDDRFIDFAKNASVLVMHMAVQEHVTGPARRLHAPPGIIGDIAEDSAARMLVLSHFMARSLKDLEGNVDIVRGRYSGRVVVADDLDCIKMPETEAQRVGAANSKLFGLRQVFG